MQLSRRKFLTLSASVAGLTLLGSPKQALAHTAYCPLLMYHHIAVPPEDADAVLTDLAVLPDDFSAHLDLLLQEGFTSITMRQLWANLAEGAELPEKPIILSFDDGYDNAYGQAVPRLLERGMVGTFFLVRDFMEQPGYLSWGMAGEMKAAGMELGNHSASHPNMTSLGYDGQFAEAEGMAAAMEATLGERPQFFCYPLGRYNDTTIQVLKDTGHVAAVTTSDGTMKYRADRYRMSRIRIRHTTTTNTLNWLVNRYL